jgi:hypothetical protein
MGSGNEVCKMVDIKHQMAVMHSTIYNSESIMQIKYISAY